MKGPQISVLEPGGGSVNQDKSSLHRESQGDSRGPEEGRSGGVWLARLFSFEQCESSEHLEVCGGLPRDHRGEQKEKRWQGVGWWRRKRCSGNRASLINKRSGW